MLGIVLIGVGGYAVSTLVRRTVSTIQTQPTAIPVAKNNVVVTTHDLFEGDLLGPEDVTLIEAPSEIIPRDSLTSVDEAINRMIKVDLVQGEMILQHNLADPTNVNHDLGYILSDQHVLFAFPATDLMSQEGVIERGDIVDILATLTSETRPFQNDQALVGQPPQDTADQQLETRLMTLDAYQSLDVTALIADIIQEETEANLDEANPNKPPKRTQGAIRTYLLALPPQDALLLKYLVNTGANFDMVIRAPTSKEKFELTPVTKEYIVELYGLGILP